MESSETRVLGEASGRLPLSPPNKGLSPSVHTSQPQPRSGALVWHPRGIAPEPLTMGSSQARGARTVGGLPGEVAPSSLS